MYSCTKRWDNFPFAHRQHNHDGHCAMIHGHNWAFEIEFGTLILDKMGFVIDFGKLGWIKNKLTHMFDHTLVLSEADPCLFALNQMLVDRHTPSLADIRVVTSCSSEGLAKWVHDEFRNRVLDATEGRVWITRVTVYEDSRNSATFTP